MTRVARRWQIFSSQHAQQRRLARTVGPDERHVLTVGHVEGNGREEIEVTERLGDVFCEEHREWPGIRRGLLRGLRSSAQLYYDVSPKGAGMALAPAQRNGMA